MRSEEKGCRGAASTAAARWRSLLLTCAAPILLFPTRATAQDDFQSHVPIPPASDVNLATLFRQRILEAQQQAGLSDLLHQFRHDGGINERQLLQFLQTHPELGGMIGRFQAEDPEATRRLGEFLQAARQSGQIPGGLSPETIEQLLRKLSLSGPSIAPPENAGRAPPPPPPPVDPVERATRRDIARHLADIADRLPRQLPEGLRNSPAVQDFFHRLGESATEALRNAGSSEGLDAQLARLQKRWESMRDMLPKQVPDALRKLRMPDLSRLSPNVRMPRIDASSPSMPRFRSGSISELSPVANVVLVVVGTVILTAVLWRVRGARSKTTAAGRPLGPWPLNPAGVTSRADLIRAFEYLSLLRCGQRSRTWHHRAIAACLGGTESDHRAAAERLAALYEQARYAPSSAAEPDWTAARAPLSFLAGAG